MVGKLSKKLVVWLWYKGKGSSSLGFEEVGILVVVQRKIDDNLSVVFSPSWILIFSDNTENLESHDDIFSGVFGCVHTS